MKKVIIVGMLLALITSAAVADVVYVTSLPQNCTVTTDPGNGCGTINTDGTYIETGITLGNTATKGTASGRPITANSSRYYASSTALTSTSAGVDIKPVLGVAGVYQIDYNWNGGAGNSSQDVVMSAAAVDGTLSFTDTLLFRRSNGVANAWKFMGYITNTTTTPTIQFRYQSGLVQASTGNRLLFDCWRFTLVQPCLSIPDVTVTGPLSTNSDQVVVSGVSASATAVTVYQNTGPSSSMVSIGTLNTGVIAGDNIVTVSGLVKGAQVAATQTIGGQEGCVPASGTKVGGGANPSVRLAFVIKENTALTGPIGAPGTGGTRLLHLGATTLLPVSGLGAGPADGVVITPSTNWQTITLQRGADPANPTNPAVVWTGGGGNQIDGNFGTFDSLALAINDLSDTGPFDIYIDNLKNGSTLIQDFESVTNGQQEVLFRSPSFSGTTYPGNILASPNITVVTNTTADTGAQSLRLRFQFSGVESGRWLRLTTSTAPVTPGPQVDLNEPISMRVLLLPVGASVPPPPAGAPTITYSLNGNQLILNWTGTFNLESKTDLNQASWDNVGVSSGPYTNTISGGAMFFRLHNP